MKYSITNTQTPRLSLIAVFALVVLVFSVTRGLVPTLTGYASLAKPTYYTATLLGVALACYGLYVALFVTSRAIGKWAHHLLVLNFFLHIIWLLPVVVFRSELEYIVQEGIIPVIFTGLLPFSVYALIKIPERALIPALGFLTLVVSVSVIVDFILINTSLIPGGYDLAFHWQTLLRPGLFETYTGSGGLYRPNGLFGHRPHDSGNILAILSVYWLAMFFRVGHNKFLVAAVAVMALTALLFTQSASNIVAGLVGVVFVFAVALKDVRLRDYAFRLSAFLVVLVCVLWLLDDYGIDLSVLWRWSKRVSSQYGDWQGMIDFGTGDWLGDMLALLAGHSTNLDLSRIGYVSEIGIVKGLVEYGIFHYFVFISMLFYPAALFFFRKFRDSQIYALPYAAAVAVGVLSLWHYGSVMRATNIFVFFALYSQALRIYLNRDAEPPAGQTTSQ